MSININVHANNALADREMCRTADLRRRKLLRLAQVREQSKEIAAQVRRRVDDEKHRQADIIERIKAEEIRAWKLKHGLRSPGEQLPSGACPGPATCVGEAHAAAKREIAEEHRLRGRLEANRRAAMRRGREALARLDAKRLEQEQEKGAKRKRGAPAATTAATEQRTKGKAQQTAKVNTKVAKNASTQVGDSILEVNVYNAARNAATIRFNSSCNSQESLDANDDIVCVPLQTTSKPAAADVHHLSDDLSSSLEIEAEARKLAQALPIVSALRKPENTAPFATDVAAAASPVPAPVSPIRAASELIRNRRSQHKNNDQPINWFVPSEEQSSSVPVEPLRIADAWSAGLRTTAATTTDKPLPTTTKASTNHTKQATDSHAKHSTFTTERVVEPLKQRNRSPNKRNAPAAVRRPSASPSKRAAGVPGAATVRKSTQPSAKQPYVPQFNKPTTSAERQRLSGLQAATPDDQPPMAETQQRVQYYDHANRFAKEYEVPTGAVVHAGTADAIGPNAMQAALAERRRDVQLAAQTEEMRKTTELRGQNALQRAKTRKDYELMSAQLDAFTKQPEFDAVFAEPNYNYTEERLQQMARDRQGLIDDMAITNSRQKPPAIVTCPRVDNDKGSSSDTSSSSALNVATAANYPRTTSPDADASVLLLDYVDRRAAELETSLKESENLTADKTDRLKSLLQRINEQREQLLKELRPAIAKRSQKTAKTKQNSSVKQPLSNIFQSVQNIEREKRKILGTNNSQMPAATKPTTALDKENVAQALADERSKIQQREKDVRQKERRVEQKLRQMFTAEQRRESAKEATSTDAKTQTHKGNGTETNTDPGAPVQIIIQVNGGTQYEKKIHPHTSAVTTERVQLQLDKPTATVFPKTPAKTHPTRAAQPSAPVAEADGSSTSTAYQSLPKVLHTDLGRELNNAVAPKAAVARAPALKKHHQPQHHEKTPLGQYITRLLGMSRASIDQLAVSSVSSVDTPSSSVLEVDTNNSNTSASSITNRAAIIPEQMITDQRLDNLQRFIDDNRSFISDLEESMNAQQFGTNDEENMKAMEALWMKTLAKQEAQMRRLKSEGDRLKEALRAKDKQMRRVEPIKPILKKAHGSPKRVHLQVDAAVAAAAPTMPSNATSNAADSCNARIADLTEKIEQIRREKQRLLESTYSSMGSTGSDREQNSTEYADIGAKPSAEASENSSRISDSVSQADHEAGGAKHAAGGYQMQHTAVAIGVSRDSGINVQSRPLTASDAHSPEPKSTSSQRSQNAGPTANNISSNATPAAQAMPYNSECTTDANANASRPTTRPPISLNRFAPHIEELDIPHELSTITEVDTPAITARTTNATATAVAAISTEKQISNLRQLLNISATTEEKLRIRSFTAAPPHEETRITTTTMTSCDLERSSTVHSRHSVSIAAPQIQPFPSHSRYAADDANGLLGNDTLQATNDAAEQSKREKTTPQAANDGAAGPQIQPFPSHKEYALGASGLCTSASIAAAAESATNGKAGEEGAEDDDDDDNDSFPDVQAELMRRNLLSRPFPTYSSTSSDEDVAAPATQTATQRRKSATVAATANLQAHSVSSTSTGGDLEVEMQKVGLNWASSMMKKTRETQHVDVGSSSSSSSMAANGEHEAALGNAPVSAAAAAPGNCSKSTSIPSEAGQPLNLKEFLARELLKRTTSLSNSSSGAHDDSTLASQFLRSLLGSTNSNSDGTLSSAGRNANAASAAGGGGHRTSTPRKIASDARGTTPLLRQPPKRNTNQTRTSSPTSRREGAHLFSGESGMSSVRDEHSGGGSLGHSASSAAK